FRSSTALLTTRHFASTDPEPPESYPLSLHDALPISGSCRARQVIAEAARSALAVGEPLHPGAGGVDLHVHGGLASRHIGDDALEDRKSTRLNSSHEWISYAVFCLKKKKKRKRV